MIRFLAPGALAALALAVLPVLIHVLQRRRAKRAVIPTVRFVPAVAHSALRARRLEDLPLLVLRVGVITLAALAAAAPIVITPGRQAAWDERRIRAIVVDASRSMGETAALDERVEAARADASAWTRIDDEHLRDGLRRAIAWLETAPPGRREIVVISDLQHGALSDLELAAVPSSIGLRFLKTPGGERGKVIEGGSEFFGGRAYERRIAVDEWTTSLVLEPSSAGPAVRIEGAPEADVARLLRVVRSAGAAASAGETIVRFARNETVRAEAGSAPDAVAAAVRLAKDPQVRGIAFRSSVVGRALVVTTPVPASSLEGAVLTQAAIAAWRDPQALNEYEVQSIGDSTLQRWSRPAAPADPSAWRYVDHTDARLFWALTVALLGVEWWIRRRARTGEERYARAA